MRIAAWAVVILANGLIAAGQTSTAPPHRMPVVPQALLERPIDLRANIGSSHDAIAGTTPQAQRFYDQGLTYLHNYVWIEAARSFNQALRLDPRQALAYVGLSAAYEQLNQRTAAHTALDRARAIGATGEHERQHLLIAERQRAAEDAPRNAALLNEYRKALDGALSRFPQDAELWLQRGTAESPDPADRGQGSPTSAIPFYNRALAVVPDHFAAHHYLTHAYENGGRIQEALEQGAAYARLASAIPHARHMYGHDLRRLGRIREAIAEFAAADALEREYLLESTSIRKTTGTTSTISICWERHISMRGRSVSPPRCSRKPSTCRPPTWYKPSTSVNGRCCFARWTATRPRPRPGGR